MPNKKIQLFDLTQQQNQQKKPKPVASKKKVEVIDLTQQKPSKPVASKSRDATTKQAQASKKKPVASKSRNATTKQAQASKKKPVAKQAKVAATKQAQASKKGKPSEKKVTFKDDIEEVRYFYKKDPVKEPTMQQNKEFLASLQTRLMKKTRKIINLKKELQEECKDLKKETGFIKPDLLTLCDRLETMLYKEKAKRKTIVKDMLHINKKLKKSEQKIQSK